MSLSSNLITVSLKVTEAIIELKTIDGAKPGSMIRQATRAPLLHIQIRCYLSSFICIFWIKGVIMLCCCPYLDTLLKKYDITIT